MPSSQSTQDFTSEGFDLDAVAAANGTDVVYEIGGGVSAVKESVATNEGEEEKEGEAERQEVDAGSIADEYKAKGNDAFREKNWLEAIDMYTAAIEALPGEYNATDLLNMQSDFEKQQQAEVRKRLAEQDEERRRRRHNVDNNDKKGKNANSDDTQEEGDDNEDDESSRKKEEPMPVFRAPSHQHAGRLSVLHANRAAALMALSEYDSALRDVNVALLWNPTYVKALLRRASLYEKMSDTNDDGEHTNTNTEAALADAKRAQQLDSTNKQIRALVNRLQKVEDERMEKLKAETLDKLKDLGNSILGNFGLSLDNFKAVQDPKSGSYSISFDQGNK